MVNIRTVEYEYKMISSFYDNYKGTHIYDDIKETVLGIKKANEIKNGQKILKMHKFLVLVVGSTINFSIKSILCSYLFAFGNNAFMKLKQKYGRMLNKLDIKDYKLSFELMSLCKKEKNFYLSYFLFVLAGLLLNLHFKDYVVIPLYLFEYVERIKDEEVKFYFLDGLIQNSLKTHKDNLKKEIIETYRENAHFFTSRGIKNVWLFGSISKDQYNDFSDIDIVIDCENKKDVLEAYLVISRFNKQHFDKKSDIQTYENFIEHNPTVKLLKLI